MPYYQFTPEDGEPFGSFEVFYQDGEEPGWYWQACFPGCLPDGDPQGPFPTSEDAINDANDIP